MSLSPKVLQNTARPKPILDKTLLQWQRILWCVLALYLLSTANLAGWADCKTHYGKAVSLLETTTHQAQQNQHPSQDAFTENFRLLVGKMQTDNCMTDLMALIQKIQTEQQKHALPSDKTKPVPIWD